MARQKKPKQRTTHQRQVTLELPPHENAEAHARLMARLEKMTPQEILESAIRSGIYSKDGKLLKPYAPTADDHLY